MDCQDPAASIVVSLRDVSKSFGHRRVLDRIGLDIAAGQVHVLLGQNGSGKSTLIKILSGIYEADRPAAGEPQPHFRVNGKRIDLPFDQALAASSGLTFVHQDLPIIGSASIMENLRIGRFRTGMAWRIDWRQERRSVATAIRDFGIHGDPDQPAQELPEADRAMLAILRGLQGLPPDRPGLLVLDEPTAHLPRDGVDRVFAAIRRVAGQGHGILLITHRLDEVFAVTDRVSVIRDGVICHTADTARSTERELVQAILGFELGELYPARAERRGDRALGVAGLKGKRVQNLSFELRRGEILGLTGLIGAGQEEVPYLIFGGTPALSGTIIVKDRRYAQAALTPRRAMQAGMALVPADRRAASGVAAASVRENVGMPVLRRFFRAGILRQSQERHHVDGLIRTFEVKPPDSSLPLGSLSGGNQQKAILAKWFQTGPAILLLHEPTQGVDVGSRRTIFQQIRNAAASGAGVLLVSTEYADLANLCDRVLVMRNGRQVAELSGGALTEPIIVAQCMMNEARVSPVPAAEPVS